MKVRGWPGWGLLICACAVLAALPVYYFVASDDPGPVASSNPDPSTKFVATSLLDIEVTTVDLSRYVPAASLRSGAISMIDDTTVVVDADGHFYAMESRNAKPVEIRKLATRLNINSLSMRDALIRKFPDRALRPGRVSDLLFLAQTGELFAAHTFWHPDRQCLASRISSLKKNLLLDPDVDHSARWQVRFETGTCLPITHSSHESGGRMWPVSPRELLLTLGHFGISKPDQYVGVDIGKIVRIDITTGESREISRGHRNPQGLTMDSKGRVWSTEHGPKGGDELNLIVEGRDYGWPMVSYGTDNGKRFLKNSDQHGRHEGYEKPRHVWVPSIGVSNLIAVNRFSEHWKDDLLVISMTGTSLHRLRLDKNSVILEERVRLGERLRDIIESADGTIHIWTDKGNVLRLRMVDPNSSFADKLARLRPHVREILLECATCHTVDQGGNEAGKISIFGIHKKPFAQGPDDLYSEAMLSMRGQPKWWDDWQLDRFLADPQKAVPGNSMNFDGVKDWSTRQEIIGFLKTLY